MLHRAATSAYSWWWASHIRTKQSKWLEQNLQDMEEKVQSMLKIIEQDGDSFAKRAEMYYKKRPELISFVEEAYKGYRALAERFDYLSKDLQSANRTIATVFPEQVQLSLESDDEESLMGSTAPSPDHSDRTSSLSTKNHVIAPKNLPKAPKLPKQQNIKSQSMLATKRDQLRRNLTSGSVTTSSGLNKDEAFKEIDTLQKDILSMQTEKEFVKSSYESALAKFLDLENEITKSQSRVCALQDEFGIGTVIEDHEARSLMAGSALKSCAEALAKLQEERERSMEEVKVEYEKIKQAHERVQALKEIHDKNQEPKKSKSFEETLVNIELEDGEDVNVLREKIREQLKLSCNSSFTEPEMADKIDDLVEKIISLETTVCSQNALVKRLREEIDGLLGNIKSLEEQKFTPLESSSMTNRLRELEEELIRVKSFNKEVVDRKNSISAEITEASCKLDHLQEKIQDVKPDEDVEYPFLSKEAKSEQEVEASKEDREIDIEKENFDSVSEPQQETRDEEEEEEEERQGVSRIAESTIDTDLRLDEEDGLNWRQLYLNNMEDREKILVEEYTIILRDYKDMKMKLNEVEKKHRDNILELASLVRELRNTITAKDEEIEMLRRKLSALQTQGDQNADKCLEKHEDSKSEKEDILASYIDPDRKPLFHHLYDRNSKIKLTVIDDEKKSPVNNKEDGETRVKINIVAKAKPVSRTEGRFRTELDDLLEGNLDFWLRFSTSFHQIQKFQNSIKDLQADLAKLKETQKKGVNQEKPQQSIKSDARPLYKHLREIQTELTLWLEHSAVFQEELKTRFSSLNNIQDEIAKVSSANCKEEENELSDYQAAKFQGEVLNMKQENSKVAEELQAGIHRVKSLKFEVGKILTQLDKDFGLSETKTRSSSIRNSSNKPRIPLHSFLFGMKLKKQKQKPRQSLLV